MDDKIEVVIEDSEETPSDVRKRIKVLEMPVFSYEDKKRVERAIEKIDKLVEAVSEQGAAPVMEIRRKVDAILNSLERAPYSSQVEEMAGRLNRLVTTINDARDTPLLLEIRESISRLIGIINESRDTELLVSMRDNVAALAGTLQQNEERIVLFLGRTVENMENIGTSINLLNNRLNALESKVDEKMYTLDSSMNYLKGSVIEAADKVAVAAAETDKKINLLVENVNEKFDAHVSSLGNRIDNLSLQVIEPINDISLRVEKLKGSQETIDKFNSEVDDKMTDLKNVADNFSIMLDTVASFSETVEKKSKEVTKKMDTAAASLSKKMKVAEKRSVVLERNLRKTLDSVKKKDSEVKILLRDVQKINNRLSKMDDVEFLLKVIDARKRVAKIRLPKIAREEKKRVSKSIEAIENDIIDLSIIALVRKKKTNMVSIKKSIMANQQKVEKRVKKLVTEGRIKKERLGRYFVYSAVQ